MKRKITGICLATILSLAVCACGSQVEEQSVDAVVSEETMESQASVNKEIEGSKEVKATATPKPAETETPKPTEKPAVTEAPKPMEKPAVTEAPKPTEKPAVTEAPKPTEKPVVTEAPKPTEKPVVTEAPNPTEKPTVTAAPTNTPEPVHTHSFADRVVSEATCTDAKVIESVCTVCGASNGTRTEGGALGHDMYEDWFNMPTCTGDGWVTDRCTRCGYAESHAGTPLGHDWEEHATTGSDCRTSGVTRQTCKRCGAPGDSWENGQYGDHTWVHYSYDKRNFETGEMEHFEGDCCDRCGVEK